MQRTNERKLIGGPYAGQTKILAESDGNSLPFHCRLQGITWIGKYIDWIWVPADPKLEAKTLARDLGFNLPDNSGYVDCGECPNISLGCYKHCAKAKK